MDPLPDLKFLQDNDNPERPIAFLIKAAADAKAKASETEPTKAEPATETE